MKNLLSIKTIIQFTFSVAVTLTLSFIASAQVRVLEGEVGESRGQVRFSNGGLSIQLKVVGEMLKEAKGIRTVVEKAVDDTGKDLLDEKASDKEFKSVNLSGDNSTQLALALKISERKATVVKEISGYLEIFVPTKDPKATVTIAGFLQNAGQPLVNDALKAAGVEVTVWTREQYEVRKKAEEAHLKKEQEEKRKKDGSGDLQDFAELLVGAMEKLFGGLVNSFDELSDTSVVLTIKDPNSKILDIGFEDAKGEKLSHSSSGRSMNTEKTSIYDFNEKLTDASRAKFTLLSASATVKVPFKLSNVALP